MFRLLGCIFIFLIIVWTTETAENNIRILLEDGSATTGAIEVYHGNTWGVVCEDSFGLDDAAVACKQLGYQSAVGFKISPDIGKDHYHLDEVNCRPGDRRLQECAHDGFGVHDCGTHENAGVVCSGGVKELVSNLYLAATHYWSCDEIAVGQPYNFKNSKQAVINGAATLARSPVNSGFRLQGKSSWVDLGDFSDSPCLVDPSSCMITIAAWIKIDYAVDPAVYLLGNVYNTSRFRGFTIYTWRKHRMHGYISGSQKYCRFWDYHVTRGYWFHFMITWNPAVNSDHMITMYRNGGNHARRKCYNQENDAGNIVSHKYMLGLDPVLHGGNTNENLDVSFDDLAIWFDDTTPAVKRSAFLDIVRDIGGFSINEITIKLPEIDWEESYSDTGSAQYGLLQDQIKNQLTDIYSSNPAYYSVQSTFQESSGSLAVTLKLNYTSLYYKNGYLLYRSFLNKEFLNTTVEFVRCESMFEFCEGPQVFKVTVHHTGKSLGVHIHPILAYYDNQLHTGGYTIVVQKVDGSSITTATTNAPRLASNHGHNVQLSPSTNYSITVAANSFKGTGFWYGNTFYKETFDGAPSSGPPNVAVSGVTSWEATVTWDNLTHSINGELQSYDATIHNALDQLIRKSHVNATETLTASFSSLYPGQHYDIKICAYSRNTQCGAHTVVAFQTVPLLTVQPPRNLSIVEVKKYKVTMAWLRVPWWSENGDMIHYLFEFTNHRTNTKEISTTFPITEPWKYSYETTQVDLKGYTQYTVDLFLVNQVGQGPGVNAVFMTKEGVPSESPAFVIFNSTAKTLTFQWPALDIEVVHGLLLGYRCYYRLLGSSSDWMAVNTTDLALTISVRPLQTYEIRMCGFTAVGEGLSSPNLVKEIPGKAPKDMPLDVTVTAVKNDSLDVEWRFVTPDNRPVMFFIITATRNDTNDTQARGNLEVNNEVPLYKYTIKGLQEFKWYNIHIAAGNTAGMGPFDNTTVQNRTAEGIPSASPRNLTGWNTSSTSMFLQWLPVLYEYADGIILGYRLYWSAPGGVFHSLQVNGSMNTFAAVENLQKFTLYEVRVSAFTSVGEGVYTTVFVRTDEDVPGHPPVNIVGYHTSSRSLRVDWNTVPSQWCFGIIRGFKVNVTDTRNGETKQHSVLSSPTSFEVTGLERYTNYSIQVAGYTVKGVGNFSEPIIVITDEDIPSEGPSNIVFSAKTSTSLTITWDVLPVHKAHGIVQNYYIYLNRVDGQETTRMNTQPYNKRNTTFSGLDEYVEYSVEVSADTIKGEGNKSAPINCLTDEDVPHAPPQNLHGYNTSDTSLQMLWEPVPRDDKNGIIIGYQFFYSTVLRDGTVQSNNKNVGVNMTANITHLLPFKDYDVQIAAKTSKGVGPKSVATRIRTEEESPKLPPGEVKPFNTSSTSITLSWLPIPPENVSGILRGYKIQWQEVSYNGTILLDNETRLDNISITSLNFHGLTKYQEYRFRILAFTKFDGVFSSRASTFTDEDIPTAPPSQCLGANISKNEIQVEWDVVPRKDRNGIILGYNIYSDETQKHIKYNNLTVANTVGSNSRSFILGSLKPYFDYTFQVVAFTSKGEGPRCSHFVVRTEEEAPQVCPTNLTLQNTSSTSLHVIWQGLNMSYINGIFRGYTIWFTALPQFPHAYLTYGSADARRRRRATFTLDTQDVTVGLGQETVEITNLAKYTKYSVHVTGLTKFIGVPSIMVVSLTDEDKPSKYPQNFHGYNLSSSSLELKWSRVPDGFVHGILRGYRLYYRFTTLPTMPPFNKTYDATTLSCVIQDLLMFTNYTFQITAFTSKGEGPYTDPIIVSTDEDVATKSPLGFRVTTLFKTHEIPMVWNPVPNGFLNGILVGYRIKMRQISEGLEDVDGQTVHFDLDTETLSYTARNLPNFSTFTFQVVALTKYGEGVHSYTITAKTCPCEKKLTTNWFPLPPYSNKTGDEESGIFIWLIDNLVEDCCGDCYNGHGWSDALYKVDGRGQDGFKSRIASYKENIDDETDFHFPVQGHALQETYLNFYSYVFALGSPGVAFFIVDDPPGELPNAVLTTVTNSWSLAFLAFIFSCIAGMVLWFLEAGPNEIEFPRTFIRGAWEGLWWAYISMSTVGYGDRAPQSFLGRIFAVFWVLTGLIVCSILMGFITNSLTTISFDVENMKLYGTKVAAIEGSPSYRVGIRRNAKVNADNTYNDAYEIQSDLVNRKVKGALIDGYMAGAYHQLFEDKHVRVKEIIDYNNGYGVALGGESKRLRKCFKQYVKRKRSHIVDYIASQIHTVKKNPVDAATERSSNLFNPEADIFKKSIIVCSAMLFVAVVIGLCLQVYFKRRSKRKVEDSSQSMIKHDAQKLNEFVESFNTRMTLLKQELYNKHINELRMLSGLKRLPVEYDILAKLNTTSVKEDRKQKELNDSLSNSCSSNRFLIAQSKDEETRSMPFLRVTEGVENRKKSVSFLNISDGKDICEEKPDIKELQSEAYMDGLRRPSEQSQHPYSKMYRYLWVEND